MNEDDLQVMTLSQGERYIPFSIWSQFLELRKHQDNKQQQLYTIKYNKFVEEKFKRDFPNQINKNSFFQARDKIFMIQILERNDQQGHEQEVLNTLLLDQIRELLLGAEKNLLVSAPYEYFMIGTFVFKAILLENGYETLFNNGSGDEGRRGAK